jgi:hypothetical protein
MRNRDTRLTSRVDVGSDRYFVLFPLPSSDNEYREFMQHIRGRFPAGVLLVTVQNGIEILTGPISALHVLFPHAAAGELQAP